MSGSNFIDLTNKTFGLLKVIERGQNKGRHVMWTCECICGNQKAIYGTELRRGNAQSCGCRGIGRKLPQLHDARKDYPRLLKRVLTIIQRCHNKKATGYSSYGAKGITVCKKWRNEPSEMVYWLIKNIPEVLEDKSIDRKDNAKGYEPNNLKASTALEQANNRSNNIQVIFYNKVYNLKALCIKLNITYDSVYGRYKKGIPIQDCFELSDLKVKLL